jgi:hypothetical protein
MGAPHNPGPEDPPLTLIGLRLAVLKCSQCHNLHNFHMKFHTLTHHTLVLLRSKFEQGIILFYKFLGPLKLPHQFPTIIRQSALRLAVLRFLWSLQEPVAPFVRPKSVAGLTEIKANSAFKLSSFFFGGGGDA